MPSKASKWGNSIGVRLPSYVVERTRLRPGDYLYVRLTDAGDIVIRPVKARDVPAGYQSDEAPATTEIRLPTDEEVRLNW